MASHGIFIPWVEPGIIRIYAALLSGFEYANGVAQKWLTGAHANFHVVPALFQ
jgi:hypothetical protein